MENKKKRKKLMSVVSEIPDVSQLQLTFFPPTETEILSRHVDELKESANKVRKGVFARHTKLAKQIDELSCQINEIKHSIKVLESLVMSAMTVPINLDSSSQKPLTLITLDSVESVNPKRQSRRQEIITDLYQLDLFEECK